MYYVKQFKVCHGFKRAFVYVVPISQVDRYFFCSAVSSSIFASIVFSFSSATFSSISFGTVKTFGVNFAVFAMYSGVAIGVAIDYYSESGFEVSNGSSSKQEISPAGQLTLLGFRVGRRAAFCGEFGIGTLSILNMGFSYKFGE